MLLRLGSFFVRTRSAPTPSTALALASIEFWGGLMIAMARPSMPRRIKVKLRHRRPLPQVLVLPHNLRSKIWAQQSPCWQSIPKSERQAAPVQDQRSPSHSLPPAGPSVPASWIEFCGRLICVLKSGSVTGLLNDFPAGCRDDDNNNNNDDNMASLQSGVTHCRRRSPS